MAWRARSLTGCGLDVAEGHVPGSVKELGAPLYFLHVVMGQCGLFSGELGGSVQGLSFKATMPVTNVPAVNESGDLSGANMVSCLKGEMTSM